MSLSPGFLLYHTFHRPKTWLVDRRAEAAGRRGETEMRAAAAEMPPVSMTNASPAGAPCRFLTGSRYYHQTIFCARSLEWACNGHVRIEIFGDGTLTPDHCRLIRKALPHAVIFSENEVIARLDHTLPASRFPLLRVMRNGHPLMRKLVDMRAGLSGPALLLDSDMLFFRRPEIIRTWLNQPSGEFFMQQRPDALVCERHDLAGRLSQSILPGVNSGIVALQEDAFDWPLLEDAAARLTAAGRSHMWAEQSLYAFILSRRNAKPLPSADYLLCHGLEDFLEPLPVLRHYVNKAKAYYTAGEWRRWLQLSATSTASQ